MELYERIAAEIAACREKYADNKDDAYGSVCYGTKLEVLQELFAALQAGKSPEAMRRELEQKLPNIETEKAREAEHPTFDWYGEHYHYMALDGTCDAYQTMIDLLRE